MKKETLPTSSTHAKTFKGVVVSTAMKDTAVVQVERFEKHSRYGKYIQRRKKFKAHDLGNSCVVGDKVTIQETKPISRGKTFVVVK